MRVKYQWKKAGRIRVKPEIAARELERIRKKHGTLQPEDVVEEASRDGHPLHDCFTWDDTEAARQHRLEQARHLIRVLVIVRADDDSDEPLTVRAYAHIVDESEDEDEDSTRHYISMTEGLSDDIMRARILADALKELKAFRKKFADLREFAALFAEIDRIGS